jgi:hypothetical protein
MLWLLAAALLLAWIVALAFKITAAFIHLLLLAAIVLFLAGFVRGRGQGGTRPVS